MTRMDIESKRRYKTEYVRRKIEEAPVRLCECGCGREIPSLTKQLRPRRYVSGHHPRAHQYKDHVTEWYARARARKIKGKGSCELAHITGCKGRIEVHHLDRDYNNNDPANLMRLCMSHHGLVEHGWIDLSNPVMPRFKISGGKRRYAHTYPHVAKAVAQEDSALRN